METPFELAAPKTEMSLSANLLAEQSSHTLENTVLLGVVRVVFARNLEDSGEGVGECVYCVADALCNLWWAVLGTDSSQDWQTERWNEHVG